METYVVDFPPELNFGYTNLVNELNVLRVSGDYVKTIKKFNEIYKLVRRYEDELPRNKKFHKGGMLYDLGIFIIKQQPPKDIQRGKREILLAYIEDLIDYETIELAQGCPAYQTLKTHNYYPDDLLEKILDEVKKAKRTESIPKRPVIIFNNAKEGREIKKDERFIPESVKLENKIKLLEEKKEKEKKKGLYVFISSMGLLGLYLYSYFINLLPFVPEYHELIIIIIIFGLVWCFKLFINPFSNEEKAFLQLNKILEDLDNIHYDDELNKIAYERIIKASNYLEEVESLKTDPASWYLDVSDIEYTFINNLRTRVAPALQDGSLEKSHLLRIIFTLILSSVEHMKTTNDILEKQLEEGDFTKVSFISMSLKTFLDSAIGKIISPIIIAFSVPIIVCVLASVVFRKNPFEYIEQNFAAILAGGCTLLAAPYLSSFIKRRET